MNNLVALGGFSLIFVALLNGATTSVIGNPNHSPLRVINGTTAADGEFPYMVQIMDLFNYLYCGGTIIGDKWILTSVKCSTAEGIRVVYGTNELAAHKNISTTINVTRTYQHPLYSYKKVIIGKVPLYDVAIIELEKPIPFDANAQPIKLADANAQVPFHKNGTLSGWGVNDKWGVKPMPSLQKINLQLLTDEECSQIINKRAYEDIWDSTQNVCSNDNYSGQCRGDAGGPFVVDGVQYGVTSWSIPECGTSPGAYSRLTTPSIREFIKNVTGI
ncbi:unnamed protein product [Ceutorhynchus assimilis]|uniref:Peptidase S1 domain-containing protein n=1 Tax=Ceutorhynchus assimilis TaxID=467358 RepID=A0A9N9MS00_9CUCU|nr:unnamed protein product [Ceutorhynchus assimilis]